MLIVFFSDSGPQKTMIDDKKDGHVTERWVAHVNAYQIFCYCMNTIIHAGNSLTFAQCVNDFINHKIKKNYN